MHQGASIYQDVRLNTERLVLTLQAYVLPSFVSACPCTKSCQAGLQSKAVYSRTGDVLWDMER